MEQSSNSIVEQIGIDKKRVLLALQKIRMVLAKDNGNDNLMSIDFYSHSMTTVNSVIILGAGASSSDGAPLQKISLKNFGKVSQ